MTRTSTPIGVLIMAYGGPDSLEEIPGYLADIRSGRPTTSSVLEEITDHYRRIGGRSPLLDISRRQVDGLAKNLGPDYACYLGMRHWSPWIEEVIRDMIADDIRQAVSLVLTPQFSRHSVAKYQAKIQNGLRMYRGDIEFTHISSYHDHPKYVDAMAARVREGLDERNERDSTHVVFSAHSLPTRIIDEGDPYDTQCRESAALVAKRAGLSDDRWSWCYQSAGKSPEPWLGPQLEDYIGELAARGINNMMSVPVGFVSDHVEMLFDIDIEAQDAARSAGVRLTRPAALNDAPLYIDALTELVQTAAAPWIEKHGAET